MTAALIACFSIVTESPATAQTIETPGAMPLKAAWLRGGPYGIEYIEVPIGSTVTGELADTRYPSTGFVVARIKGRPGQQLRIIVEDHGYPMALAVYRDRASGDKGNAFTQQPQKGPIDALFALPPSGVVFAYYYGVSEKDGIFGKKRLSKGRYGFRIVDADAPTAVPDERIAAVAPPSDTGAAVQQTSASPTSPTASPIREGASAILAGQSTFQEYPAGKTVKFTRHVEAGQGLDVWIRPKGAPYISIDMCMKSPSGARTCTVRNAWARPPYVHLDYIAPVSGPVEFTIKTSNFDAKSYTLYVAPLAINRTAMLAALHAYDGVVWQTNDEERNGVKMNVFETHSATPDGLKMVNEYANGEAFFVEFRVAPDGRTWIVAPNQPKIPVRLTTAGQDGTLSLAFDETGGSRRGYSLYPDRSLAIFQEVQTTGANAVQLAHSGQAWGTQPKLIDPAMAKTVIAEARTRFATENAVRLAAEAKAAEEKRIADAKLATRRKAAFAVLENLMAKRWIYTLNGVSSLVSYTWEKPGEWLRVVDVHAEHIANPTPTIIYFDPVTGILGAKRTVNGQQVQATKYAAADKGGVAVDYDWGNGAGRIVYTPNGPNFDVVNSFGDTTYSYTMNPIDDTQWAALHQASQNIINARNAEEQRAQQARFAQQQAEDDAYWNAIQAQWAANRAASANQPDPFQQRREQQNAIVQGYMDQANALAAQQARQAQEAARASAAQAAQRSLNQQAANNSQALADRNAALAKAESDARAAAAQREREATQAAAAAKAQAQEQAKGAALAEAKRKEEERNRPVAFKEGVVLCAAPQNGGKNWRCQGPLQVVTTNLDNPESIISIGQACGSSRSVRPLGTASGYRAFGCGFGIHPSAGMRDYPGNDDVQARLGVGHIPGQGTYMCPVSVSAYCRGQ